jgi:hypothetical protein
MRDTRTRKPKVAVKKPVKKRGVKQPVEAPSLKDVAATATEPTPPKHTPPPIPTVTPILGISVERGVFLVISTAATDGELSEVRLATEKPFSRVLAADSKRCRMASMLIKDDNSTQPKRVYVAFVPTPPTAVVAGVIHGCAKHQKQALFFNIKVERYESLDRQTLRKLLFILSEPFAEVMAAVLPESAPIREEHRLISGARERQLSWKATFEQVKTHLENKEAPRALALIEPLVFSKAPRPEAEKLLAEMLVAATPNKVENASDAFKEFQRQKLLLEHLIRRLAG